MLRRRNVMKMKVGATALLMSLMAIDRAFAGYTVYYVSPKARRARV